jgi:DNA-binding response OmpR family regulator
VAGTSETSETPAKVLIIPEWQDLGDLVKFILDHYRSAACSVEPMRSYAKPTAALVAAERDPPDLIILMHLNPHFLPDGECHRFRASRASPALRDIPILFMCVEKIHHGFVDKQARRFAANGYVVVPFEIQELLAAYDAMLGGETYYPPLPDES